MRRRIGNPADSNASASAVFDSPASAEVHADRRARCQEIGHELEGGPDGALSVVFAYDRCPPHAHDGITESYICLSGAVSENHQGVYAPGSLIFNPPGAMHRITVSDREPSLLAYAWIGPEEKLANQKMVFSRARAAR